jgi:DNA-binding transcriptional ArsR family regulator
MPARKGDRPFCGLTNEARKIKVSHRREAVLSYLRSLSERTSAVKLAHVFGVSLRTIMYDLEFLFQQGLAEELRSKFLESAHTAYSIEQVMTADPTTITCSKSNLLNIKRGKQLRSGRALYSDLISFSRGRLSFEEYQVLHLLLKEASGELPGALYKKYVAHYYHPTSYAKFQESLYRLVSLRRVFIKPISAKRQIYIAYPIAPKMLECAFSYTPPGITPPKKQSYANLTNYSSYWGRCPSEVKTFTNRAKNKLVPLRKFHVEFNLRCECGGPLTTNIDGIKFCRVCGLVTGTTFIPGTENISITRDNSHFDDLRPRGSSGQKKIKTPFECY